MPASGLTRRASLLLLPFLLARCGGEERVYPPLRYSYLPPIRLAVADIVIQQRFVPSGMAPDVTRQDPERPLDALRAMAEDRLQTFGGTGRAVFAITDASLTKDGDTITGHMAVQLSIEDASGVRVGFAQAEVARQHSGHISDLPGTLYDMTKAMVDAMNVEFEYQVHRNLRDWLVPNAATPAPVQAQPLDQGPPGGMPPEGAAPGGPPSDAPPAGGQPPYGPPPGGRPIDMAPPAGPPPGPPAPGASSAY
jgi:hypothetical protein